MNHQDHIEIQVTKTATQLRPDQIESNSRFKSVSDKANVFSKLSFFYGRKTALRGFFKDPKNKEFEEKDLLTIPWYTRPDVMSDKFTYHMQQRKKKKPLTQLNLILAVLKTVKWHMAFVVVVETLTSFIRIFSAWVTKKLIDSYLEGDSSGEDAYKWAGVLTACLIIGTLFDHQWDYNSLLLPTLIQNALIDLVYGKILKLSTHSITHISPGRLLNMATSNLSFLTNFGQFFPSIFVTVFAMIAGGAVIWQSFGAYALIGIGYVLLWHPVQILLIVLSTKDRTTIDNLTNERVKTTSETIEAIRLLKMYIWEYKFKEKIESIRKKEVSFLKKTCVGAAISRGCSFSMQDIGTFFMFIPYYYAGNTLKVGDVFCAYFVFNYLRLFSCYFVAAGFMFAEEAHNVFKSIEKILEAPEIGDTKVEEPRNPENSVEYENYSGFWETDQLSEVFKEFTNDEKPMKKENIKPTLHNINLEIKKGSLNALVGAVGSGKTSFLMSFTGEMPKTLGSLRYKGSIAYVEQEPTIFAGTFKENILFGKPFDKERYQQAIEACNLVNDLRLFSKGDDAEIVGGGMNLSGGQKARLAFARAVYADADIYLLDDPLSAVDPKVAGSLYKNAIEGVLKGKTIILVTHQVDYVKNCENIIAMEDGKVLGSGTLEELTANGVHPEKIFGDDAASHGNKQNCSQINISQQVESLDEPEFRATPLSNREIPAVTETGEMLQKSTQVDWNNEAEDQAIISKEKMQGRVSLKTYWDLLKAAGGTPMILLIFLVNLVSQLTTIAYGRMLGAWMDKTYPDWCCSLWLGVIVFFSVLSFNAVFLVIGLGSLRASKKYHEQILTKTVNAKTLFFDTNSVGQIINRFSKDIGTIDRFVPVGATDVLYVIAFLVNILITVGVVYPVLIGPTLAAFVIAGIAITLVYPSIEQSKLFELKAKDQVFGLFSETLRSIVIARMFNQEGNFKKKLRENLNKAAKGNYSFLVSTKFAGFISDMSYHLATVGCVYIITGATLSGSIDSNLAAFVIALILGQSGLISFGMLQFGSLNISMQSVARVQGYCDIPSEPPQELEGDRAKQQEGWPDKGKIEMKNVYMKYRPDGDFIIKDLNLSVKPGEKIGCVGRTGAGKSTIVQMLYRMREIDRKVKGSKESFVNLDDVNSQAVGLKLLRRNISMIPQTPYIFSETVRTNIDPLGQHTDEEIWRVLEDVRLKEHIEKQSEGLDTKINGGSAIFSVGQKQLVCLARVVLKPAPVLIMDEATANMDHDTDNFLQEKIDQRFANSTRFTIAHRLTTIAGYDKVLVLSKGRKVEFDEPYRLLVKNIGDEELTNKGGHFAIMVQNTGPISSKQIFEIAKNAYFEKHRDENCC